MKASVTASPIARKSIELSIVEERVVIFKHIQYNILAAVTHDGNILYMNKYLQILSQAELEGRAIGHFNISNLEGLWGVIKAAESLSVPVIIGVSEGEREFMGIRQVKALVDSVKAETDLPIFLNADHTYTFEGVKQAVDAGFDSVIFDGSKLPYEENVKITKQCVEYAKSVNPDILVEGELGYIGTSSKMLDDIPEEVLEANESAVTPEQAEQYVSETGVDLLAPAVGNLHGMLKGRSNPNLDIDRIRAIRQSAGVPLVLHGGSGITDDDFRQAIKAGISIVHISTELRVAFHDALKRSLQESPDELAPYRIMKPAAVAIQAVAVNRLQLFSGN